MIPKWISKWWVIAITAFLHGFLTPPWNHEKHWLLFFAPFISTIMLIPFFNIAELSVKKWQRVMLYWLYGIFSVGAGSYWILDVKVEGMPLLMYQALAALALFFGAWFIPVGMSLSHIRTKYPQGKWFLFPAIWVLFDFLRCLGELSFPWHFEGYSYVHFLPFSQIISITGIWGLTFLIVASSYALFLFLVEGKKWKKVLIHWGGVSVLILIFGVISLQLDKSSDKTARFALLQTNMDQENWNGYASLDSSLTISDSLLSLVAKDSIDFAMLPESGVFCYLTETGFARRFVKKWPQKYGLSVITGTLHRKYPNGDTLVFNSCFYLNKETKVFHKYFKQRLVPFGESMPFQGLFPLINRIDLGGGHFSRGEENTLWKLGDSIIAAPTICYEAIYPTYIRRRARESELLLNITNDGWFGDGSGPYQHRTIARARVVENGIPIVRVANSGISYVADQKGRYIQQTSLGSREVIVVDVPLGQTLTLYRRFGNWFLWFVIVIGIVLVYRERRLSLQ